MKHATGPSSSNRDPMDSTMLQETLRALEVELHHPGVRCNRERLETLLHPGFHEVGRSGRPYTRDTIIRYLLEERDPPMVVSDGFAVALLAADCALLTYRSAHLEESHRRVNHTLRSSVWLRTEAGWQLRYHQGTPALEVW